MKFFRKAILVIHGFSAGLSDNEYLVNQLELNNKFDVFAWTLPAHEKNIINKVKYTDWIEAVDSQVQFLIKHGYRKIYVVGHSMGGLLSGYLASKYPEIKKVVFLSAAYDYFSGEQYKEDFRDLSNLKDDDAAYKNFFHKLMKVPITTIMQFRKLVNEYKECICHVTQEALVIHGDKDEVVPYDTMNYIKENIKSTKVTYTTVEDGRHVLVRGSKQQVVIDYIESFLIGGRKWKQKKKSKI